MDDYDRFSADVLDESSHPVQVEIGANVGIGDGIEVDLFALEAAGAEGPHEIGAYAEIGLSELGMNIEIGAALALGKVLEKVRDNRQPAPPMKAVDLDAPERDIEDEWALTDTCIGAAAAGESDPFPLLTSFMQRCGSGMPARVLRVDTQESYDAFRAAGSPEMAQFRERLEDLERKLSAHSRDPYAHERLADEWEDLTYLGQKADQAVAAKSIEFDMPPGIEDHKHDEWLDGDEVFASLKIAHEDGGIWWLTSAEPLAKSVNEASRAATEAAAEHGFPASVVVGMISEIGERIGAATVFKEMVAAVPSILQRPEAKGDEPFVVRIEPKGSPALCGLVLLVNACRTSNAQACDEWQRLGAVAPAQVKQAMTEALELVKKAA